MEWFFTFLASRALHLEVAYSLDMDACINSLGPKEARILKSDNGSNFVGAERQLWESLAGLNHSKIQVALLQNQVEL